MTAPGLAKFKRWWLQRPTREKLMIFACSFGVVLALGDSLLISPQEKRLRAARGTEVQLQTKLDELLARRKSLTTQDQELRLKEGVLRARLQAAQERMAEMPANLINTAQLPEVLRAVVATVGGTRVLELSLGDEAAAAATAPATPAAPASAATGSSVMPKRIYRLPVTLKVSGSWVELNDLLRQLEQQAPGLHWQSLSLDNSEWPAIQMSLRAHVRSLQPRWGAVS